MANLTSTIVIQHNLELIEMLLYTLGFISKFNIFLWKDFLKYVLPNLEIEKKIFLRLSKLYVTKNNPDPWYLSEEESLERKRFHPLEINGANSSAGFGLIS